MGYNCCPQALYHTGIVARGWSTIHQEQNVSKLLLLFATQHIFSIVIVLYRIYTDISSVNRKKRQARHQRPKAHHNYDDRRKGLHIKHLKTDQNYTNLSIVLDSITEYKSKMHPLLVSDSNWKYRRPLHKLIQKNQESEKGVYCKKITHAHATATPKVAFAREFFPFLILSPAEIRDNM